MNYFWKNLDKKGQEEIGFIGNYNIMTSKEGKVFAYVNIYYLPLMTNDVKNKTEKKIISVILYWNFDTLSLTDGSSSDLIMDLDEIIKLNDKDYFGRSNKNIDYYVIQIYGKHSGEDYKYITHGTQTYGVYFNI